MERVLIYARQIRIIGILSVFLPLLGAARAPKWSVDEITLTSARAYANPYTEVQLSARFMGPGGASQTVLGFWDGDRTFRIRFTPAVEGKWSYKTSSNDPGMDGRTGSLQCVRAQSGNHGFVRRDASHPYYWIFDDGTRYLMVGTTYYEMIAAALDNDSWKTSVDNVAAYGIDKIRFRMHQKICGNRTDPHPCSSPYGQDHDHLNLEHFRAADRVVQYLLGKGVIADLMPFDSATNFYGTDEQDERFLKYVLARYAAYPNVIWCLSNEYMIVKSKTDAFWNRAGAMVREDDPNFARGADLRPLSIHCCGKGSGATSSKFYFYDQPWPVHAILQTGRKVPGDAVQPAILANLGHNMPVVDDESGYMGDRLGQWRDGYDPAWHRQTLWAIYMAGASASTGDKGEYDDGRPYHSTNWHDRPEYGDVKRLVDFFTTKGIAYWRMSPHNELSTGERDYVLAEPGRQYAVYAAAGGSFRIKLAPGRYTVHRFNPRDGEDTALREVSGGWQRFAMPDSRDWAVYLEAEQ